MEEVTSCRRRADAAGVIEGRPDLGWICGRRRGEPAGERLCVDLSPDRPEGRGDWHCEFRYSGEVGRICTPASHPAGIGAACSNDGACPRGARCVGHRCLPPRPRPDCWLDSDCRFGERCHFSTCTTATG
jgi:hypothetical protein